MTDTFSDLLTIAADRRLSRFLPSASAAFVFEPSGRQVLWANAAGLDEAGEQSLFSLRARRLDLDRGFAEEIVRAAAFAPDSEPGQIHLIRFPWGSRPRPVAWRARRLGACDGWSGLFLMAADQSSRRPDWPLIEALIRLFPDAPVAVLDRHGGLAGTASALDPQTESALSGPLGPALAHAATCDRIAIVEHALPDRVLRLAAIRVGATVTEAVLAVLIATEPRPPRPLLVSVERNPRPSARRIVPFRSDRPLIREVGMPEAASGSPPGETICIADPAQQIDAGRKTGASASEGMEIFLHRLPLAMVVFGEAGPLFTTRAFLDLFGHVSFEAFIAAGGLGNLLPDGSPAGPVSAMRADGSTLVIEARLFSVPWAGGQAMALAVEPARLHAAEAEDAAARRIGDVLAGIGREIRTPLNSMLGFSEIMFRERFGPIGDERYRGYLRDILASGAHILGLLDGLMELANIQACRGDRTCEEIVVNDLVRASAALAQPQADRAQVVIRIGLARGTPMVRGDRASLQRSVIILLANAVAATSPGGQVIVSTAVSAEGTSIRVHDVGAGPALDLAGVLAEASRARLAISSEAGLGSIAEILFGERVP